VSLTADVNAAHRRFGGENTSEWDERVDMIGYASVMDRRLLAGICLLGLGVAALFALRGDARGEADRLVAEARVLFEEDADVVGAVARLDEAIALEPELRQLYQRKGEVLTAARRDDEALATLAKALALDRDDWETYRLLMAVWARKDMCDTAITEVEDFLGRHPEHGKAFYARGFCHYKERRWDEAFADVTRACELGHQPGCDMAAKRDKPARVLSIEKQGVPQ
jgi:tetratricopeptide (TPR) repeat protein